MTLRIYGYERNPPTRIILIVAELESLDVELTEVIPRANIGKVEYMAKFPLSRGKIPGLETADLKITETIAIVTYLARLSNRAGLLGDGSKEQEAEVLSFMSWANQELLQTLSLWFLPLIPGWSDHPPYDHDAIVAGKSKSLELLTTLESILDGKEWLVGKRLTLADIFVAVYISRGLEWVLDAPWREKHPNIMNHFERVAERKEVKKVIPRLILIEEETPNQNPYA